ncbi:nicotinamidase [Blastocystis sp. ATCC 50177/Nand II]|uniref:nicotinamidase n=1 Tax=Blastocystis sp. subtype 1 (strain ATCC 50177 / NandII) TaxID=478820 RepID=A0A196SHG0_BLAHN|nr:nicotinamidase [Blastocystis sp. ATCC 50177/Nand II]
MDLFTEHTHLLQATGTEFKPFPLSSITKNDILLIIDCQNDFFPAGTVEDGGRFGVADGEKIVPVVVSLIDAFAAKHCTIVASRDCHTLHHCSFTTNGGTFPPHCIQGTQGFKFHPVIAAKLMEAKKSGVNVIVGNKGFENNHECFSAFPYLDATGKERFGPEFEESEWCDCYYMESATEATCLDGEPDILAATSKKSIKALLKETIDQPDSRLFVCGLAFDFCVLDTAINAAEGTKKPVFIVHEATRAAHIPGVGAYGSGFLSDPKEIAGKLLHHSVSMIDVN